MTESAIAIRGVNKRFGALHAVRDLDLVVPVGSLCGFLGPNGAGKSTTIRMIMSIIYPDSGSVDVLGSSALANKDRIGYLPEERGLYRRMRVGEFLEFIAKLKGVPDRDIRPRVKRWLERVELPGVAQKRCQELSKGMQQKVQFLAAIIHEPDLIILDEPFSGLDPVNAALLDQLMRQMHAEGRTIIFSTHLLHQAERACDRIFLIDHGTKLLDASMADIRGRFDPRTIGIRLVDGAPPRPMSGVSRITPSREPGEFDLLVEEGHDPLSVLREAVATNPVTSIGLRQVSLEEVFVRLVSTNRAVPMAAGVTDGRS